MVDGRDLALMQRLLTQEATDSRPARHAHGQEIHVVAPVAILATSYAWIGLTATIAVAVFTVVMILLFEKKRAKGIERDLRRPMR